MLLQLQWGQTQTPGGSGPERWTLILVPVFIFILQRFRSHAQLIFFSLMSWNTAALSGNVHKHSTQTKPFLWTSVWNNSASFCLWLSCLLKQMFAGIIWTNDSPLLTQHDLRTGLSGSPPQLAALMDSFATSRSFLHAVSSLDWSVTSADRLQLTAWVLFHLEGEASALNGAGRDTCRARPSPVHWGAMRTGVVAVFKRLNSETQPHSPETDWPLPPWVTDIPVNPRAAYLFAYLKPVGDPESVPDFTHQPAPSTTGGNVFPRCRQRETG